MGSAMGRRQFLVLGLVVILLTCTCGRPAPRNRQVGDLIEQLAGVSTEDLGYSSAYSGSGFLPYPDSAEMHVLLLGQGPTKQSGVLTKIVAKGVNALPDLLARLDDNRAVRIKPFKGMMWMAFNDEYDYNRRTRASPPKGVNRDTFGEEHPDSHKLTLGDLCFVAIGQIVNRNFQAVRYQPSGGLVVSSPAYSRRLRAAIKADWTGLTRAKHKQGLIQDLLKPDYEGRRINAYYRLAYYYPDAVEPLVLQILKLPTYNVFIVEAFLRKKLYAEADATRQKKILRAFVSKHGEAAKKGLRLYLFDDVDFSDHKEKARQILVDMFGYPKGVKRSDRPYPKVLKITQLARFIGALRYDDSKKIDEVVYGIFKQIKDDDYLAVECMKRLIGRGHDDEIRAYCRSRIPKSKYQANDLKEILKRLDARDQQ